MPNYLVRYADQDGKGMTSMQSPYPINAEDAAQVLVEQLRENNMLPDWIQIDEFKEIVNPIDWLRSEVGRWGVF